MLICGATDRQFADHDFCFFRGEIAHGMLTFLGHFNENNFPPRGDKIVALSTLHSQAVTCRY